LLHDTPLATTLRPFFHFCICHRQHSALQRRLLIRRIDQPHYLRPSCSRAFWMRESLGLSAVALSTCCFASSSCPILASSSARPMCALISPGVQRSASR